MIDEKIILSTIDLSLFQCSYEKKVFDILLEIIIFDYFKKLRSSSKISFNKSTNLNVYAFVHLKGLSRIKYPVFFYILGRISK